MNTDDHEVDHLKTSEGVNNKKQREAEASPLLRSTIRGRLSLSSSHQERRGSEAEGDHARRLWNGSRVKR